MISSLKVCLGVYVSGSRGHACNVSRLFPRPQVRLYRQAPVASSVTLRTNNDLNAYGNFLHGVVEVRAELCLYVLAVALYHDVDVSLHDHCGILVVLHAVACEP